MVPPSPYLNHVLRCHIHVSFEHLQQWWLHHCPGQPVPVPNNLSVDKSSLIPSLNLPGTAWCYFPLSSPLLPWEAADPHLAAASLQAVLERHKLPRASFSAAWAPPPPPMPFSAVRGGCSFSRTVVNPRLFLEPSPRRSRNCGPTPLPSRAAGRGRCAIPAMAGAAARGPLRCLLLLPLPCLLLLLPPCLLLLLPPAASAEPELRFRPPAEAPVRLFTEPELARYDGHEVGPRRRPAPRPGRARTVPALPPSPALRALEPRRSSGFSCSAAVPPRHHPRPAIIPALSFWAALVSRAVFCERFAVVCERFAAPVRSRLCPGAAGSCRGWCCTHRAMCLSARSLLGKVLLPEDFRLPWVGAKVHFLSVIH